MIKIRLKRRGPKKFPIYQIVAIEDSKKRDGSAIDVIGYWIPKKGEKKLDAQKLKHLKELGGQVSQAVKNLLAK